MNTAKLEQIYASTYDRESCQVGVAHLGFGAFHRSHQAVYLDDYMEKTGDLRWGIAAVNLRGSEAEHFQSAIDDDTRHDGYFLKSYSANGEVQLRRVRSHVQFSDWSVHSYGERILHRPQRRPEHRRSNHQSGASRRTICQCLRLFACRSDPARICHRRSAYDCLL